MSISRRSVIRRFLLLIPLVCPPHPPFPGNVDPSVEWVRSVRLRGPLKGVYAVTVSGAGMVAAHGVANVGTRPTVNDSIKANLEVHILDWNKEIYGRTIEVTFHQKLRDEQKFSSLEELKTNISKDIERARAWFAH